MVPSGSCTTMVKHYLPELLGVEPSVVDPRYPAD